MKLKSVYKQIKIDLEKERKRRKNAAVIVVYFGGQSVFR